MNLLKRIIEKVKQKKFAIVLVLLIFMYMGNFLYQSQLGAFCYNNIQRMWVYAFHAVDTLKQDAFDEGDYLRWRSSMEVMNSILSTQPEINFSFDLLFEYQYIDFANLNRIGEDEVFRKEVAIQLSAYQQALETIMEEMEQSRDRHPIRLLEPLLIRNLGTEMLYHRFQSRSYYQYLTNPPRRGEPYYRSRFHERITTEFYRALEQSQ